jgi:transposase
MAEKHLEGSLAACDRPISLGYVQGTNLKDRDIFRRAYGYRDKEYMNSKILQRRSSLGAFRPWVHADNISS